MNRFIKDRFAKDTFVKDRFAKDTFIKDRFTKRRSVAILAIAVIVVAFVAAMTVYAAPRLVGHRTTVSRPAPHASRGTAFQARSSTPRGATPSTPAVQLAAQDVTPATNLDVTASGFGSGEQLLVSIEDMQGHSYEQVTLIASAQGDLAETPLIPPQQLETGSYQIIVTGSESHRTASTTFRMHDIPPTLTLVTYYGKPGQQVGYNGSGFIADERVTIYLGSATVPLGRIQATDTGAISGVFTIPTLPPGEYKLTMQGAYSQTPVSVGFGIQGFAPWVVLDRYSVTPGQSIGLTGQDFAAGEQVFVYLNSPHGIPVLRLTADTSGQISVQDTWTPTGVTGRNTLFFVGQTSKATTSVDFMVQPAPETAPQPTTAPAPSAP